MFCLETFEEEEKIQKEAKWNTQKSQNKMVLRSKAHSTGVVYKTGGKVLIKEDFDTNLKTKNRGLDTNNEPGILTIIEVKEKSLVVQKDKSGPFVVSIHTVNPCFDFKWISSIFFFSIFSIFLIKTQKYSFKFYG